VFLTVGFTVLEFQSLRASSNAGDPEEDACHPAEEQRERQHTLVESDVVDPNEWLNRA